MHVVLRRSGAALVGLLVVGACAGRSERASEEHVAGGAGGSSGKGGTGAGAATGVGGVAAAGGTAGATGGASGGTGGTGGSISVTGGGSGVTGGGGTTVIGVAGQLAIVDTPQCLQPRDPGPCRGAFEAWRFDPATLVCVSFIYGGCEGNDNRFDTVEACQAACMGSLPTGCDATTPAMRPEGCPCTEDAQCAGYCSSPSIDTVRICQPAPAGYCAAQCCTEGHCYCALTGAEGCGV